MPNPAEQLRPTEIKTDEIDLSKIKDPDLVKMIMEAREPESGSKYYIAAGIAEKIGETELAKTLHQKYGEYGEKSCEDFLSGKNPEKYKYALSEAQVAKLSYEVAGNEEGAKRMEDKMKDIGRRLKISVVKN